MEQHPTSGLAVRSGSDSCDSWLTSIENHRRSVIAQCHSLAAIVFSALCLLGGQGDAQASDGVWIVALTGQRATVTEEQVYFNRFDRPPTVNRSGQVAFTGLLMGDGVNDSSDSGIWKGRPNEELALVAREGDVPIGFPANVKFGGFAAPTLNANGQVALHGKLAGEGVSPANSAAMWTEAVTGGLTLVAREGESASIDDASLTFERFDSPVLNESGQTAFRGSTSDSFHTGRGIWRRSSSAGLTHLAHDGDHTPESSGSRFADFSNPAISEGGHVVFSASIDGGTGIFRHTPSAGLATVAIAGNMATGLDEGWSFQTVGFSTLNRQGHTAFEGRAIHDSFEGETVSGIWKERGGHGLTLVASTTSEAPGDSQGLNFSYFTGPVLNDSGHVAFRAGTGVDEYLDDGIWSDSAGNGLAVVAREGQIGPGISATFRDFEELVLNSRGQTAFLAEFSGMERGSGIWAQDAEGVLQLVVKTGSLLDVSDDPLKPLLKSIKSLAFAGNSGNGDGRPSGFNNLGQIAFTARFTDGSEGIFVSDVVAVPEPEPLTLLCLGGLIINLLLIRRLRVKPSRFYQLS